MNRDNIEKIAQSPEDRLLLAKAWDKLNAGIRRNIPAHTGFLSPREQELCRYLFGSSSQIHYFGGCPEAERRMVCFLPDYLEPEWLFGEDSPIVCLRAAFYEGETLTHRDLLGALMGAGIRRETVGDIYMDSGSCDFFVTEEIAPFLLQNLTQAGRVKLRTQQLALAQVRLPEQKLLVLRDTLASIRLDSVISAGFRISRGAAAQHIAAGHAAIDGLTCQKPDKPVEQDSKISVRGLGKLKLEQVNGQTKKGRISVVIHRYL